MPTSPRALATTTPTPSLSPSRPKQAGVDHLVLTHLIPYVDNVVTRKLLVSGMSEKCDGMITVAQAGTIIVV
ncbi:hypothetical protein EV641_105230 [Rhodococcus sp. SMB37]|uniref:hypothetical protein n=1 Tax=Rhodococcus sp. SMB37 TaxID=2512213 RepID=UPI0006CFA76E|nr:hypothetical protein [Rhodococcus sp. SMB37]TCN54205.1 hypothetical protein EV641_105230 [Rhodococcus sp. SMB37]